MIIYYPLSNEIGIPGERARDKTSLLKKLWVNLVNLYSVTIYCLARRFEVLISTNSVPRQSVTSSYQTPLPKSSVRISLAHFAGEILTEDYGKILPRSSKEFGKENYQMPW